MNFPRELHIHDADLFTDHTKILDDCSDMCLRVKTLAWAYDQLANDLAMDRNNEPIVMTGRVFMEIMYRWTRDMDIRLEEIAALKR